MSDEQYDIDNDDNLFNFDMYDMLPSSRRRTRAPLVATSVVNAAGSMPSQDAAFTSGEMDQQAHGTSNSTAKGKQVAIPMPTRPTAVVHDLFDVAPSNTGTSVPTSSSFTPSDFSSFASSSYTFSSPSSSTGSYYQPFISPSLSDALSLEAMDEESLALLTSDLLGKGKGREKAPTLPPLSLFLSELGEDHSWMSFASPQFPGLSSSLSSVPDSPGGSESESPSVSPSQAYVISSSPSAPPTHAEGSSKSAGGVLSVPTRCRSLSSLSIDSATSSSTVNTRPKVRTPSYLARKFLFSRKGDESNTRPSTPSGISPAVSTRTATIEIPTVPATGDVPRRWYMGDAAPILDASAGMVALPPPPIPNLSLENSILTGPTRDVLKHKGRSHSTPLPFSALDYVPVTSTDIFEPLPLLTKNYFDDIIPRELRLRILGSLIQVHIDAHKRMVESDRWSVNRASSSRNQWVGRDKGIKELFKLSRVSKSWRSLVFDGQLWVDINLHAFPALPQGVLQRITKAAGPFIQSFNVAGLAELQSEGLLDVATNLCLMAPHESLSYTQLTSINMQGCTGLTTRSLHHLLVRSRSLQTLNLRGLSAVTNTTCEILSTYCPALTSLNMNRCMNMDAEGIHFMATAALARGEHLQLRQLRLCGLKHSSDSMMAALGKVAPYLEVLDLSYARRLHNSALEAFVACDEDTFDTLGVDTVVVSARDLGREVNDTPYFRRRVTRLRHLNLSFCLLLTDTACANLAYSLPRLEFLEMAGIGADLKDEGLIKLFEKTPFIRRVDLEDAVEVGDAVLAALTPAAPDDSAISNESNSVTNSQQQPLQTGHALQYLNISSSINVGDQGLLLLVRHCPNLTTLEADGTRISGTVLREFVRLSKERQIRNARIVAVDCRGVGENVVKELSGSTRPRQGWRSYASRRLYYLDERDGNEDDLKIGQDECDEERVVVKTFYSWQTVDAVKACREKRKKASGGSGGRRGGGGSEWDDVGGGKMTTRWWSPGGRRGSASGRASPLALTDVNDGCRAM